LPFWLFFIKKIQFLKKKEKEKEKHCFLLSSLPSQGKDMKRKSKREIARSSCSKRKEPSGR
jgi:hypothetical protein